MYSLPNQTRIWNPENLDYSSEAAIEDEHLISKEADTEHDAQRVGLQMIELRLRRWITALSLLLALATIALVLSWGKPTVRGQEHGRALTPVPRSQSRSQHFQATY